VRVEVFRWRAITEAGRERRPRNATMRLVWTIWSNRDVERESMAAS
jgi:hypothetical protein